VLSLAADKNEGIGVASENLDQTFNGVNRMRDGFRRLTNQAPEALTAIDNLFVDNSDTMVQLLGTLTTTSQLLYLRVPALNALFPDYRTSVLDAIGSIMHDNALNGIQKLPENHFAGVLMSAFLEHEVEPNGLLQGVARVLQPGGVVIIKVPNYGSWNRRIRAEKWCGFRLPDHVNYFTPENLEALIVRQGMKVVQFGLADRQPTSDNMWIVAAK